MKKLAYIITFAAISLTCWTNSANAQAVFNDTIYFSILKTRFIDGDFKYLIDYQVPATEKQSGFTGKMVLSMCGCYCDSIWDAWPAPSDSLMAGGIGTIDYLASSVQNNNPGPFSPGPINRHKGRLNIWQMPGSFSLTEAFTLPVAFTID